MWPLARSAGVSHSWREAGGLGRGPATLESPAFLLRPGQPPGDTLRWRASVPFSRICKEAAPVLWGWCRMPLLRPSPQQSSPSVGYVGGPPPPPPARQGCSAPSGERRRQGEGITPVPVQGPRAKPTKTHRGRRTESQRCLCGGERGCSDGLSCCLIPSLPRSGTGKLPARGVGKTGRRTRVEVQVHCHKESQPAPRQAGLSSGMRRQG